MPLIQSLEGQSAIVTGGASGIGRATAELLAQADANVTIFDVNEKAGENVAAGIGGSADFVRCDMSDMESIGRAYDEVIDRRGGVDVLVNNAGISPSGGILEMPADTMARMEAVNVGGPLQLTRLIMNGMKQLGKGGCVIFVGSTQAEVIDGEPSIYNVQKNTILGITKALAVAGGPLGIRVNCVSPGAIATEGMGAATESNRDRILATNHKIPLGRRGTPEEVAGTIVYLCFNTYITGAKIKVDGGLSIVAMPANYGPPEYRQIPGDPDGEFLRPE